MIPSMSHRHEVAPQWRGHPILWNTLIFGVVSGTLLASIAYYRFVSGDESGLAILIPAVAAAWLVAGFRAAKRAATIRAGALAGLFAGMLGAGIGAVVEQVLAHQYLATWYQRVAAQQCTQDSSPSACVDAPTLLAYETQVTIILLIALPLVALALGLIAGLVGSTSGSHDLVGDEYVGGTVMVDRPIISAHRSELGQGQALPQTDRPAI